MDETVRAITGENDPSKIGILVSTIIIIGSLVPTIKSSLFTLENTYSLGVLLLGVSMFFFFMGIKVNMKSRIEVIGNQQHVFDVLPKDYTPLSVACFIIATCIAFALVLYVLISVFY